MATGSLPSGMKEKLDVNSGYLTDNSGFGSMLADQLGGLKVCVGTKAFVTSDTTVKVHCVTQDGTHINTLVAAFATNITDADKGLAVAATIDGSNDLLFTRESGGTSAAVISYFILGV